uniref:Ig-like domain-containing protein n=1 Tax=Acanthochromis polyacanthus TaxID=80966 RepID=A0A3Q1HXZ4_9TELE
MTVMKFSVCFLILNFLWTSSRGDTVEHVCDVREQCILPCTFKVGDEVVIHWILLKSGNIQAHSYFHNKDQVGLQDQRFRDRTSLFTDQISKGNASLKLTEVKLQDEGRYKCYTSTIRENKESFVNLKVEASFSGSSSETKLTCGTSKTPQMDLIWRFNHSQTIVDWKRTSSSYTVSEGWRQQVKDVSESGDITLKDLSSDQEGTYTCELSDAEETLITDTPVTLSGGKTANIHIWGTYMGNLHLLSDAEVTSNTILKLTEAKMMPKLGKANILGFIIMFFHIFHSIFQSNGCLSCCSK